MQITDIVRKGKSEVYKVYIDGKIYSLFEAEIIVKHKLKTGLEIDYENLSELKKESDLILCRQLALKYVSKGLKTEKQTKDYLKQHLFGDKAVDDSIKKLKEYGYLNDLHYAKSYTNDKSHYKGKLYIKNELKQKGISEEDIDYALSTCSENEFEICETLAKKWIKGKIMPLDVKDKQKLFRHLVSKGFEYETIKTVLLKVNQGLQEEY